METIGEQGDAGARPDAAGTGSATVQSSALAGGGGAETAASRARRLIEHLRGGVPLPPSEPPLVIGRAHLYSKVGDLLDTVAAKGSRAMALQANYGDGKTHSLRAIWHLAAERNFVVSEVALNRETPMDRLDKVYPKVLAGTYLPGAAQPGIDRLVAGITAGGEDAAKLLRFAADNLHPKIHAVLHNLIEGSSTEAAEPLLGDLARLDISTNDLKRIHKGNFNATLKFGRFSAQREVRDYFRLIDFLIRLAGHAGWVILFDEAELIARLGRGGRAKAYANVGSLAGDGLGCTHLLSVFALASNFYGTLTRRRDPEACPEWLRSRSLTEAAELCTMGLAALGEATMLESLQPANWLSVLQAVKDAHETAYGWSADLTAGAFWEHVRGLTQTDTKVRTRLRVAIQWLDLLMQHGQPPQVRLSGVAEVPLDEEAWAEVAAAGDADGQ